MKKISIQSLIVSGIITLIAGLITGIILWYVNFSSNKKWEREQDQSTKIEAIEENIYIINSILEKDSANKKEMRKLRFQLRKLKNKKP